MKTKVNPQPAEPAEPYVKIQRRDKNYYHWSIVDPRASWFTYTPEGGALSFRVAKRKSVKALKRYLAQEGYQKQSWTITISDEGVTA